MVPGLVPSVLHREGGMGSNESLCQVLAEGGGRRGSLGIVTLLRPQKHRNDLTEHVGPGSLLYKKVPCHSCVTGGQAGFYEC